LVDAMLVRAGLHSTVDFPGLFEDAANKNLRSAYEAAPQTWREISRLVSLSDFKPSRQLQVGDAPALLEILEHGEYTFGTIGEAKESIQLKTYGRMFGITRQALINDDLNAFSEVPAAFGRKARDIESDLAWAQITGNPTMGDGVALFDATTHANYTASGTAISVTSLGVGRAALRKQKGIDAATLLNLMARYLIVPAALETIADQYLTQITAALASSVNPFATGSGRTPLTPIVEPRLDANSATAWYMATDQAQAPVLYHGVLDGQEGPLVTQMEGFDVDGMKFRCRIDVAFKAADWRAIYKNVGA
jgi:phage major head subunit gpT-like protein